MSNKIIRIYKLWELELNHSEILRIIAYKERMYKELINLWIKKHPEFDSTYQITLSKDKVKIVISLFSYDNTKKD